MFEEIKMVRGLSLLILLLLWVVPALAKEEPVTAELVADVAQVQAGHSFTVGILFNLQPHWHIYWQNPGDAGIPTSIKFTLPNGSQMERLQWPLPTQFNQEGDIISYGYTDTVLLFAQATVPQGFSGSEFTIQADASWLCCKDICLKGQKQLSLTLPVGKLASSSHKQLFEHWRQQLPVSLEKQQTKVAVTGHLAGDGAKSNFKLALDWSIMVTGLEWFPTADNALNIEHIEIKSTGTHTEINFVANQLVGQQLAHQTIDTIVTYVDTQNIRRGIIIPISLTN